MEQLVDIEKVEKGQLDIFSDYAECVFLPFSAFFRYCTPQYKEHLCSEF